MIMDMVLTDISKPNQERIKLMYFFLKEHVEKLSLKVYQMSVYMCVMNAI